MLPDFTNYFMKCNYDSQNKELLQRFNDYCSDYESSKEIDALKMQYLIAAREVVESYLGYRLDIHDVTEDHVLIGSRDIYLREFPVQEVYSVKVNGRPTPAPYFTLRGDHVRIKDGYCHCHGEAEIQYCSGFRTMPDLIVQTILRIAALLKTEANGNIGETSKSWGNTGSISFLNYTNYSKYLDPLYPLRTTKLT